MEQTNVTDLEFKHEKLDDGSTLTRVTSVKVSPSLSAPPDSSGPSSLNVDSVVLSSGGFSADLGSGGLVSKLSTIASRCPFTTNGQFATGDLLKIGQRLGLETVDLDQIQVRFHPFMVVNDLSYMLPIVYSHSFKFAICLSGDISHLMMLMPNHLVSCLFVFSFIRRVLLIRKTRNRKRNFSAPKWSEVSQKEHVHN